MKKNEFIEKYGEEKYIKQQKQTKVWQHIHPLEFAAIQRNTYCKGGKYYEKTLRKNRTGLNGKKGNIRNKHGRIYTPYKKVIDPEGLTVIHHEWVPNTSQYRGVALVEKYQHQYGYIDVIQILEGNISLFTEREIRGKNGK